MGYTDVQQKILKDQGIKAPKPTVSTKVGKEPSDENVPVDDEPTEATGDDE